MQILTKYNYLNNNSSYTKKQTTLHESK